MEKLYQGKDYYIVKHQKRMIWGEMSDWGLTAYFDDGKFWTNWLCNNDVEQFVKHLEEVPEWGFLDENNEWII